MAYKLLIIDDDESLTSMLSEYLRQHEFEIEVANEPVEGLEKLRSANFDLLLLDVMMPEIDGFEVLKQLRVFSAIPIIMLTAKGEDYDRILGLELGADDYLPKPFNHRELVARIKALTRRFVDKQKTMLTPVYQAHGIQLDANDRSVSAHGHKIEVTSTEFHLLLMLMQHAGSLLSKENLSQQVLGRRLSAFDRSLDMHVSNLRKKLANCGVKAVIKTVRGAGYIFKLAAE